MTGGPRNATPRALLREIVISAGLFLAMFTGLDWVFGGIEWLENITFALGMGITLPLAFWYVSRRYGRGALESGHPARRPATALLALLLLVGGIGLTLLFELLLGVLV